MSVVKQRKGKNKMVRVKYPDTHYEHTAHLYCQLSDYFTFMVHDGNIEKPTYNLMKDTLDELFNQYKDVYSDLQDVSDELLILKSHNGELNKELIDDGKD